MIKKIKKIFTNSKVTFAFGIIFGVLLAAGGVYAATLANSRDITYDNSNSTLTSTNVQDAIDELYNKAGGAVTGKKTIYYQMNKNATLDTIIDFSKVSSDTNGKGVYIRNGTGSDKYPILYYRGAVDNNNVLFANFCWKIVRTTETGGIKLIYNGSPSNGTCTGTNASIGTSAFNTKYNSLAYVGYMYGTVYASSAQDMSMPSDEYNFGKDVTYSNGVYTLSDAKIIDADSYYSDYNRKNFHYTCFSSSKTCSNVYYIYSVPGALVAVYYITLTGGEKVEDALSEMLDKNTNDSTIKTVIDNWYKTNMISYTNKLEDTVWCNDRSIYTLNGWNPTGGDSYDDLYFSAYKRSSSGYNPNLTCTRDIDKFTTSTSNGNGSLTYPVGLITSDEIMLAGGKSGTANTSFYLYIGSTSWWTASPIDFTFDSSSSSNFARTFSAYSGSTLNSSNVNSSTFGVRPCLSLAPGTEISSGNGTASSPYIVS